MSTQKRRITFYAGPDLVSALREKAESSGAPIGELVRRAILLSLFADQQSAKDCAAEPKIPTGKQC